MDSLASIRILISFCPNTVLIPSTQGVFPDLSDIANEYLEPVPGFEFAASRATLFRIGSMSSVEARFFRAGKEGSLLTLACF